MRHSISTFIRNVKPGDEVYKEFNNIAEGKANSAVREVGRLIAGSCGNTERMWDKHYDRWKQTRDAFFAELAMKVIRTQLIKRAKVIGDDEFS